MSRAFRAEIRENLPLNRNHKLLTLAPLDPMSEPQPGQFYMVEVHEGFDPLLKRAFSLFRRTPQGIQLMYRQQGRGTAILGNMRTGAVINMLGPLGRGYPLPTAGETPVIMAGGIGIASVFSLIEKVPGRAHVIYGARTKDDLFMLDELKKIAKGLSVCTDDGTDGRQGNVLLLLDQVLGTQPQLLNPVIYACGPRPMLRALSVVTKAKGLKAYLSLEEHMACGIGACLGCVVRVKVSGHTPEDNGPQGTYQRVCKEGPVFDAEGIVWE
ncbi:MAG: dihydroorotate dehydrogenase electron transfer subunit [Thermodesulfovibrionales bacterium]